MATGPRKPGEFCWINMLTPQTDEACTFFGKLLGWTYAEIPGLGHSVKVGGRDIGGLFDLNGPNTPPGTRAHIGVMVKVDSADAIGARVTSMLRRARRRRSEGKSACRRTTSPMSAASAGLRRRRESCSTSSATCADTAPYLGCHSVATPREQRARNDDDFATPA